MLIFTGMVIPLSTCSKCLILIALGVSACGDLGHGHGMGWSSVVKVSSIVCHRGIQLILAYRQFQ